MRTSKVGAHERTAVVACSLSASCMLGMLSCAGYTLGTRLACSFALSLFLHFTPLLSLSLSLFPSLRLVTRALPLSCRAPPKI